MHLYSVHVSDLLAPHPLHFNLIVIPETLQNGPTPDQPALMREDLG